MEPSPSITTADLDALLAGHRDGAFTRCVALAIIKKHPACPDIRAAVQRFGFVESTIRNAKIDMEARLLAIDRRVALANKFKGATAPAKDFADVRGTDPAFNPSFT